MAARPLRGYYYNKQRKSSRAFVRAHPGGGCTDLGWLAAAKPAP